MKKLLTIFFLLISAIAFAQRPVKSISVIDFVKIKNNKAEEALYFYNNNWKIYRDIALQKGQIKAYKLLKTKPDSISNFDLILMTEFADSVQFKKSEENFGKIINSSRPGGSKLLNGLQPNDFRAIVFSKTAADL